MTRWLRVWDLSPCSSSTCHRIAGAVSSPVRVDELDRPMAVIALNGESAVCTCGAIGVRCRVPVDKLDM
jgi:hypothetical protein